MAMRIARIYINAHFLKPDTVVHRDRDVLL